MPRAQLRTLLILLVVAVVAVLGLVLWRMSRGPTVVPAETARAQRDQAPPDPAPPGSAPVRETAYQPPLSEPTPAPTPAAPLSLRARLLPFAPDTEFNGRARIGIARISDEDRREYHAWLAAGSQGAGPSRLEDLANVVLWTDAPVTPHPRAGATLGPVEVPRADLYRVVAWSERADGPFYLQDFTLPADFGGEQDLGNIPAQMPTGLRLRLMNDALGEGQYLLRLSRIPNDTTAERASALRPVLDAVSPEILNAYQEEFPLVASVGGTVLLAPLYPDPAVRITPLTLGGAEGRPVELKLVEGQIQTVSLNLSTAFPDAEGGFLDLRGRLVYEGTDEPVAGATIERLLAPIADRQVVGEDGTFLFRDLPRAYSAQFQVQLPELAEQGRPRAPRQHTFSFRPEIGETAKDVEVTWELPQYRWLLLDLPEERRAELTQTFKHPYPIYALEYLVEESGAWHIVDTDEFLMEPDAVAISVEGTHVLRVLMALSPVAVIASEPVALKKEDSEVRASLGNWESALGADRQLLLLDDNGNPLPRTRVRIVAANRWPFPPLEGVTDREGRLNLGPVTAEGLFVTVLLPSGEVETGAAVSTGSDPIIVRLEPNRPNVP